MSDLRRLKNAKYCSTCGIYVPLGNLPSIRYVSFSCFFFLLKLLIFVVDFNENDCFILPRLQFLKESNLSLPSFFGDGTSFDVFLNYS
jgi:hypothetical protein